MESPHVPKGSSLPRGLNDEPKKATRGKQPYENKEAEANQYYPESQAVGHVGDCQMIEPKDKAQIAMAHTRLYVGLSSGAVILVATFLRDLFADPALRWFLIIALTSFAICIGASNGGAICRHRNFH